MTEQLSVSNQKAVPKHRAALQEKYDKEPKKVEKDLTSETAKLPIPTGWRLLVLPFKHKQKTKGGIIITCLLYTSPSPRDQRGSGVAAGA